MPKLCHPGRSIAIGFRSHTGLCHPERSIAIGFINRNAKSRDLLFSTGHRS
jgi:hypothetical protein